MVLTIEISPEVGRRLVSVAAEQGRTAEAVAAEVLESTLVARSLDEVLRPFRAAVAACGLDDEALDDLFQEVRQDVWDAKHPSIP